MVAVGADVIQVEFTANLRRHYALRFYPADAARP